MTRATIRIEREDEVALQSASAGFRSAWTTSEPQEHIFSFSSPEQLFSVLSPKRWTLIETLQGLGPTTYRALAAALERDVKRVHDDTAILIEWGLVEVNADGRIHVPFDIIRADFALRSVA